MTTDMDPVNTTETKERPPKIIYYIERKRNVVVVCDNDPDTGKTTYGASIFVKPGVCEVNCNSKTNSWSKKPHRQTAQTRFDKFPVHTNIKAENFDELKDKLRKEIFKNGVQKRR